jgi:hypothetical protein
MGSGAQSPAKAAYPSSMRRNTILAIAFLLMAIAIAGTLAVLRIYSLRG